MLDVYIGYDCREAVAYEVCKHSLLRKSSVNVNVHSLCHKKLRKQNKFYRPWYYNPTSGDRYDGIDHKPFSTEFSHTRFLVPDLQNYQGWALFMDCDMLWMSDIKKLIDILDDKYALMCVKHNHKPSNKSKMDGQEQTRYHMKNWSSFVAFNCSHPSNKELTLEKVNRMSGRWLHQFSWLKENEIGALPPSYNWIENFSPFNGRPDVVHYTEGGPWFDNYTDVAFAQEWVDEYERFQRDNQYYSEVPTMKHDGLI